jgi:hypothetical protein
MVDYFLVQNAPGYQGMLDTGTATPGNFAQIDYFLIQDLPGYQGMLDTGTATSKLTWQGWLPHSDLFFTFQTSSSGMLVPPTAFPRLFKFASGGGMYLCQTLRSDLKWHLFYSNWGVAWWE